MAGLIVRPRARIFHGHEWVYGSEIKKVFGDPQPGDVITLKDFKDRPLGSAIYNPASQIVARRLSRRHQDLDADFIRRRLHRALSWRQQDDLDLRLARLVWSEADGLPGLIVDRFEDCLVVQTTTLAFDQRLPLVLEVLLDELQPRSIVLRNDSSMRLAEGLEEEVRLLHGPDPGPLRVTHQDLHYEVYPLNGQKTGLYLDILDSYAPVARHAPERRVLDVFCNQGGFSLSCARAGAREVRAVDISEDALASTRRNAEINDLTIHTQHANAFDFLREDPESYDLIILDPPSFSRNKKSLNSALRGYKEIHLRALKKLNHDGVLATFCCSHHVSRELFLQSVIDAAVDAKKTLRLLSTHAQRRDHPILPTLPETEYLKGFIFQLIPNR